MGKPLYGANPNIVSLYQDAEKVLGYDVGALCFEGPEEKLNQTEYTQPALLVTSLAAWQLVREGPLIPTAVAGHSLGEYTALVAAGAIGFSDAVALVQKRGQYMAEAVSPGSGLVAAVLGLSESAVFEVCKEAEVLGVVAPANLNSPGQTVIAGEKNAVERALEIAKTRGAKRVKALPVSVPVHTPLMQIAADRLKKDIDSLEWTDLKVPLINNVEAKALRSADEVRMSLVKQLPSSVRWQETIHTMWAMGITNFIEIGPGKVLTGLVKRIVPEAQTWNISDQESYEHVVAHMA
jgi:[acyl-carrier-protein] S-malonyltransferase